MFKKATVVCFLFLSIVLVGCIGPFRKNQKAVGEVDKTKNDIGHKTTELADKSIGYVYGADFSLSLDKNPNKYSEIAKDFTQRSLLITGNPNTQDALVWQKIVQDLLSTNEVIRLEGEKKLAEKDKEVIGLEKQVANLNSKLEKKEEEFRKVANENSVFAQKWANLWFWIKLVAWVLAIGFILSVISNILPPPYNHIGAIIALPISLLFKGFLSVIPKAAEYTGVVSKKIHDVSETTVKDLVEVIQEIKDKKPDVFIDDLEPVLKNITSKEISRKKIAEIKASLGYDG